MTPQHSTSWESVAEQASKEPDPAKLMLLIAKLCHALDVEHAGKLPLLANETRLFRHSA
jgi:hypothetical protein